MRNFRVRQLVRGVALVSLVGFVGLIPPAQAYHVRDVQRNAHRLDERLSDLVNDLLRTTHHQGELFTGMAEMRLIMSVSALGGQARALHRLVDRREPADVRVAFDEMVRLAHNIDWQIRTAHVAHRVADRWHRAREPLTALGRDIYGEPHWNPWGLGKVFLPSPYWGAPWGANPHAGNPR